jgi:hypothetical protein
MCVTSEELGCITRQCTQCTCRLHIGKKGAAHPIPPLALLSTDFWGNVVTLQLESSVKVSLKLATFARLPKPFPVFLNTSTDIDGIIWDIPICYV